MVLFSDQIYVLIDWWYKKIAARHGIPEGTVKWHLNKIKKDLKELHQQQYNHDKHRGPEL